MNTRTTVKELIAKLQELPQDMQVYVADDEELNNVHWGWEVSGMELDKQNNEGMFDAVVIFPLSGQVV